MAFALTFTYQEAEVILNWHENTKAKSERFGSARFYFPQEELLLEKLHYITPETQFDEMDTDIIIGWMEKSLRPVMGQDTVYFPLEKEIIKKLKRARKVFQHELKDENEEKRETAIQYADRLIYEKKLEQKKKQQENLRQKYLQERIKANKEQQESKNLGARLKHHLGKIFIFSAKNNH